MSSKVNKIVETKPAEISRLLESIISDKNKNHTSKMTDVKKNGWLENDTTSYNTVSMTANHPRRVK
jgi:hypothetical protein